MMIKLKFLNFSYVLLFLLFLKEKEKNLSFWETIALLFDVRGKIVSKICFSLLINTLIGFEILIIF